MQKKLFFSYLTIILLAIGISVAVFWSRGYNYIDQQSQNYYLTQAKLVADIFSKEEFVDTQAYYDFANEYAGKYSFRITIVDREGQVYADSDTDQALENHASREEIVRALAGESNTLTRYSKTMGQEYSYSAVPVTNGAFSGVLRISLPLSELKDLRRELVYSLDYAIIICLIIAMLAAFLFTKLLAKPINEVTHAAERISNGDYSTKIYTREKDQIGRLAGAFNIMTANLKSTVDNLTQRNAELEAMLSSMSAGVIAIDDLNEVLLYNNAFADIIKLGDKQIKGQSIYNFVRNSAIFDTIDLVRAQNTSITEDGLLVSGNNRNIRVTGTPMAMEGDNKVGVLLIIEDITKVKKLETMRRDFVSNVTHELKTPLTSIRGFIDTLKNGAIKEEAVANRFLDIIDIEAERLYSLIQDILLLSEIESKQDMEMSSCDVNQCTKEAIDLLESKLSEKVTIIFDPVVDLKQFSCNPDRMKQLVINLLDNAIKYTEQGTITIACKEQDNNLVINVKDTGIGMAEHHLNRIFERFYRADTGRSRKQGGTGLGLSIVKHIVELYNGTIKVNSELDVGTEFEVQFPYNI